MSEQRKRKFSCPFVLIGRIIVTNITLEQLIYKINCKCVYKEKLRGFSPLFLFFMCFNNNLKTAVVTNITLKQRLNKNELLECGLRKLMRFFSSMFVFHGF
jgi:hypothetical protein